MCDGDDEPRGSLRTPVVFIAGFACGQDPGGLLSRDLDRRCSHERRAGNMCAQGWASGELLMRRFLLVASALGLAASCFGSVSAGATTHATVVMDASCLS